VNDDPLVTAEEAAAAIQGSPKTIYTWVRRGQLTPVADRPYRFRLSEVYAAEKARRVHWRDRG
jgi:predicted site-specific integrase-resolvase